MALALIFLFLADSWKDGVLKDSSVKWSEMMPQKVPNQYIEKKYVAKGLSCDTYRPGDRS